MAIYLDYNASAPIEPRVIAVMTEVYTNNIGNPDSRTHSFGENANKILANARDKVSTLLKVNKAEIIFTSGATESNNIALQGLMEYGIKNNKKHILTTSIEHKSILETANYMRLHGFEIETINPEANGRIDPDKLLKCVRKDTLLVCVMHANNETGIIQPVDIIGKELEKSNILFLIDITQTCGKLVEEIQNLKYDMLSFSAHKLRGPQGIGVLILKKKHYKYPPVKPIMFGGGQEHGFSPGTVPVALAAGLGKACEIALVEFKENALKTTAIKHEVLNLLNESGITYKINGDQNHCLSTTLNVSIMGVSSEALMLSTKQFCGISNGSACSASSYEPSYVLKAMNLPKEQIESALRISWGPETNIEELKNNFGKLLEVAKAMV